jgi:hypothetical protein
MSNMKADVKSLSVLRARKVCEKFHVFRRTAAFPFRKRPKSNHHLQKSGKSAMPSLRKISGIQLVLGATGEPEVLFRN